MKKFTLLLAALLLTVAVCLAGCSEYSGPSGGGGTLPPSENPSNPSDPENPAPSEDDGVFTVSLVCDERPFSTREDISAIWTNVDGYGVHTARFDRNGVARLEGLDGDYKVTLSALPSGYTYDSNIYTATNDDNKIEIELYEITPTSGAGTDYNTNAINLDRTGTYRANVTYPGQTVFYRFEPKVEGVYFVRSMVDVTANVINPVLEVYIANTGGYANWLYTVDDGAGEGAENTYTKNVYWEMEIADNYIGSIFVFAIRAEGLNDNAFPVNVDFRLEIDNNRKPQGDAEYVTVTPEEDFKRATTEAGQFKYAAYLKPNNLLDGSQFKLYSKADGGDGYYHFYDEATGIYGKTLYAKISKDNEVFTTEDSMSGTVYDVGFTYGLISKKCNYKDYTQFIARYAQYTNADGAYPVTEELKTFLQEFSIAQGYFRDGEGDAETIARYNSTEENQWLFACGYYG